jgi:outer membrane receptor protein involved in Fe transport
MLGARRSATILIAAVTLTISTRARADGVADEAELHFQIGAARYIAKDYTGALEHFLISNRLVPNRNVVYNIARAFEQLERYADAHRYYVDALQAETDAKVIETIKAAMARIAPKVAVLDIESDPPGATIYIDRKDLGSRGKTPRQLAFPAGKYKVLGELEGHVAAESPQVEIRLGASTHVKLSLPTILGMVLIQGEDGVGVHVDDEKAAESCKSPCDLQLPPGSYTLFFTRPGFRGTPRQVTVVAQAVAVVRPVLTPLTGSLLVSADEREALVEIDGRSVGFTPVVVPNVLVGTRKVKVSLRGYTPVEREVQVDPDQQAELLDVRLQPVREVTAASRFTESIEDAPSSVSIIPPQELRAFGYPTIAEAVRGQRGITLSNDGAYDSIGVRGIGQPNDYGNRLLVLADGAVMNDNIVSSSYVGFDGRTDLGDVERIEIVRGAGSVLYGTGAVSGVVNLVTRGRDSPDSVEVTGGAMENGVARVRGSIFKKSDNDSGIWASVSVARSEGRSVTFGNTVGSKTGSVANGVDRFTSATTAGRVWYGPFTAQWFYTSRDMQLPTAAYSTDFNTPGTHQADTRALGEVRYEPTLGKYAQLLLRLHVNTYHFTGAYSYQPSINNEQYDGSWGGAEARLVITPLDDPHALRITLGGTGERHARAQMRSNFVQDGATMPVLNSDNPHSLGAGYLLAEYSPSKWLRWSVGARLDHYDTFGDSFNPRISVIVKPTDVDVIKVFAGKAFRAPSVYELYYNDGGATEIASPNLKPETVYSGELEYSHRFLEDWVALAAVHASDLEKIIDTVGDATMDSPLQYVNSPQPIHTYGGDIELRREWRQGWMLGLMYGYQSTRYYQSPPPGSVGANTWVPNAPEHLASFRFAVPVVPGLATLASRATLEAPRRISLSADDKTDAGVVWDVVLSGDIGRYNLRYTLGIYNLFDWRYAVPITPTTLSSTLVQNPRTLLLELTLVL